MPRADPCPFVGLPVDLFIASLVNSEDNKWCQKLEFFGLAHDGGLVAPPRLSSIIARRLLAVERTSLRHLRQSSIFFRAPARFGNQWALRHSGRERPVQGFDEGVFGWVGSKVTQRLYVHRFQIP